MVTLYAGKRIQTSGKGSSLLTISSNRDLPDYNEPEMTCLSAIIQTNDGNRDFILTKFSNLHVAPEAPSEPSWY